MKTYKIGSNQYRKREKTNIHYLWLIFWVSAIGMNINWAGKAIEKYREPLINPFVGTASAQTIEPLELEAVVTPTPALIDIYVSTAVDEFFTLPGQRSEMRMIMHCLLNRETRHDYGKGHGDNGMAGGPLQFWNDTWNRMRGRMIKDRYATEIGSRYDLKEAIRTTVYAIKQGWGKEWGPILRYSKGDMRASCPVPSFYN